MYGGISVSHHEDSGKEEYMIQVWMILIAGYGNRNWLEHSFKNGHNFVPGPLLLSRTTAEMLGNSPDFFFIFQNYQLFFISFVGINFRESSTALGGLVLLYNCEFLSPSLSKYRKSPRIE